MRERAAWPPLLLASLLLSWPVPASCLGQSATATRLVPPKVDAAVRPATALAPMSAARRANLPSPSSATSAAQGQGKPTDSELPPSSVSSAIERFVKRSGIAVPDGPVLVGDRAIRPMARQLPRTPSPVMPPTSVASQPGQDGRDLPAGLPEIRPLTIPREGDTLSTLGPSPFEINLKLKPAPLNPTDLRFPISLADALRLADARPLTIASAQASVWVAEAELERAKVLWVPMSMFAVDYLRHDGGGPDFNKGIMTAPSVNYFMAGICFGYLFVNLSDAYFQPLVQRPRLSARQWEVQAAKNDSVMNTADAYFRVHQYRGMYSGALYTVMRGRQLVERVAQLSRELVPLDEVDRARNMLADLEQRATSDREEWRIASADLTRILRLDPRAVVVPVEHDHVQITLVDPGRSLDDLMPIAMLNRPELASRRALIQAAEASVRREKWRPLLPIAYVGGFQTPGMFTQAGIFGLGPNSSLNQWALRSDVSLQLIWQLEGFGLGNLARIKAERGRQSRAIVDLFNQQDGVVRDVTRALARVQSAAARVLQADRALRTAIITFNGHLEGLEQTRRLENMLVLTFRPQEAVYSLEQLNVSFDEYFTTVAEYNRAQFDLFHALGYPASEITVRQPPGDLGPVDVSRPQYLPPVGHGPPPVTR